MKKRLLDLFLSFLKIGAFTFGGGYAMIALIEDEVVTRKTWLSAEEILDIVAISETTPGPLSVNAATYIGYKVAGIPGSIVATVGLVLPSFFLIAILSLFIIQFKELAVVEMIFKGIRSAVVVLIFNAVFQLGSKLSYNWFTIFIILFIIITVLLLQVNPILMILASAFLGVIYGFFNSRKKIDVLDEDGGIEDDS